MTNEIYISPFALDPTKPPLHYSKTVFYKTDEERHQLLEDIIDKLTRLYVRFLTPEGHQNLPYGMWFFGHLETYPTIEEVELLRIRLKESMSRALLKDPSDPDYKWVYYPLTIDYAPQEEFGEIVFELDIDRYHPLDGFLPCKSHTMVEAKSTDKKVSVEMRLEGPPF